MGPAILIFSMLIFGAACIEWRGLHADDAYIIFRYAQHLAEGHGPVFNIGEYVEGYSCPLFMLMMAGGFALDFDPMVLSRMIGVFSAFAILIVLYRGLLALGCPPWASAMTTLPLAASPALQAASVSGMETLFFAFVLFWGLVLLGGSNPTRRTTLLASLLLIVSALTRPEGIAYWFFGAGLVALTARRNLLLYALPLSLWLLGVASRYAFYGELLPNTYFVRVGGGAASWAAGARELNAFLSQPAVAVGFGLALLGGLTSLGQRRLRRSVLVLGGAATFHLVYVVSVGGDSLGMHRFQVAALAPIALLVGLAWIRSRSFSKPQVARAATLGVGLAVAFATLLPLGMLFTGRTVRIDTDYTIGNLELGRTLGKNREPETLIAVSAAGIIPFVSGLPTLDLYGLTDAHIARQPFHERRTYTGHAKWDADYAISRRPELVIVNKGYIPMNKAGAAKHARIMKRALSLAKTPMEEELYARLLSGEDYELRTLELLDGSHFMVFERTRPRDSDAPSLFQFEFTVP